MLRDCLTLAETIGLESIPYFTTIEKAAKRLLVFPHAKQLLDASVKKFMGRRQRVDDVAIDSTGMSATCASAYFVKRRSRENSPWKTMQYHRFPKLGVVCEVISHFILAYETRTGPKPDVNEFESLIGKAHRRVKRRRIVADAGYDSESNHRFAREDLGLVSIIPPKHGRPTKKPATGKYRRQMQTRFNKDRYRQRAQVETVMSMIKRRQGSHCKGKTHWSRCRELTLMVLFHNILILRTIRVFYRAGAGHFFPLG